MFGEMSINSFLDDLASSSPAPGGGAAAALTGALGAALVGMVCSLTAGKKGYEEFQEEISAVRNEAARLQQDLNALMQKDADAFNHLMSTFKLPRENDSQQAERTRLIQEAYRGAAEVPFLIAWDCLEVVRLACRITGRSNLNVLSDVEVAMALGAAGMEAGMINIEVNLPYIKDSAVVAGQRQKMAAMKTSLNGYISSFEEELGRIKDK